MFYSNDGESYVFNCMACQNQQTSYYYSSNIAEVIKALVGFTGKTQPGLPTRIFKCVYFLQQILIHVYAIILPFVSNDSPNILHNIYS